MESINLNDNKSTSTSTTIKEIKVSSKDTKKIEKTSGDSNYTYTTTKEIGSGSFGTVYLATIAETGECVAIKKVFQDKRYKNRELQILNELDHPNLVKTRQSFFTTGEKKDDLYLNVVMEYVPETLSRTIRQYNKSKTQMPMLIVKIYAYQMLRALHYIHSIGICHRDIKPQNVLTDPTDHSLKFCDFGSAKKFVKGEPNVAYICSRYYRAPELIFGATDYDFQIDVWSSGCVIAETVLTTPLFPGESAVDQLVEVIKILGTPSKAQILAMNPEYNDFRFPVIKAYPWQKVFKSKVVTPEFIDLISKLLVYEPKLRLTPLQALCHPFFDELRDQNTKLPNNKPICDLFNFNNVEIKGDKDGLIFLKLVPKWYKHPESG